MTTFEEFCESKEISEEEKENFRSYLENKDWNLTDIFTYETFNTEYNNFRYGEEEEIEDEDFDEEEDDEDDDY